MIIWHFQIDTLPTQKLELTYHELSCSRLERKNQNQCNIEDFNFKNEMSHVKKIISFQVFVNFSTDSDSHAIKFFKTGFKYAYLYIYKKILKIKILCEQKKNLRIFFLILIRLILMHFYEFKSQFTQKIAKIANFLHGG